MASEQDSTDSNDLESINFRGLNLSDNTCTRTSRYNRPKHRQAFSANNSFYNSPQSDGSSSSCSSKPFNLSCNSKQKRKPGFARKLPPMGIYWDIENVRVPKMKSASAVVQRIREIFLENYRESEFVVVCDVKKEHPQIVQELNDSQVNLIHVSSTSKNAADEKLRQSLRRFADIHPAPSAILLITGDINFASDLSDLRHRKKVRIILVHNVNVADALILCANEHHLFTSFTENLPAQNSRKSLDLNTCFFLTILNLPKNIEQAKIKNRLKFLTNNCGGKCIELISKEGVASLKFGNFDLALRAQKRIQGEDVFGQKIKVLAPSIRSYTGQKLKTGTDKLLQGAGTFNNIPSGFGYQQLKQVGNVTAPLGFDNQRNVYPYNPNFRRKQDSFRPSPQSSMPMDISYEPARSSRETTMQDQLQDSLARAAMALPPFDGRVHHVSGSSEFSDSDGKNYMSTEPPFQTINQPVDLNITNLDPTIEIKELKRLLINMIKEYAMILQLNVVTQGDGQPIANLKVNSQQEAQFIISQLHRQKLGHKRIVIAYKQNNLPDPEQLKAMVISILQEVPDKRMPLFKFMELLEVRYQCNMAVAEVNKLKDIVRITDERGSRMVSLTEEALRVTPAAQTILPHCIIHYPKHTQNIGWCEANAFIIPNLMIPLTIFAPKLMTLLNIHFGSMPLLSFQACFEQEYQEPLPISENGVPLEHLVTCIPHVEIQLVGPNKSIKVIKHNVQKNEEDQVLKSVALPLAPNVNLLCREVVDLLKNIDKCQMALTKFIPAYHHHFGRQCRVADYGYTKLLDLFEAISHVVQIMGDGHRRVITLTHSAQIRRFTSDLLRVLKIQPNKQIALEEFPAAYEKAHNKPFNPIQYGLCTLDDLLCEIQENTVMITRGEEGVFLSVPKREQTPEEVAKTKQFANEVIDLLRHTPYYTMLFDKFVPSYHHHFGHQCRVSDYGFSKLIELFEAIPDVVEVKELPDGGRTVGLTLQQSLNILGSQVVKVIRSVASHTLKLEDLPLLYFREFGYPLNSQMYQCRTLEEVVEKLSEYVQVIHSNAGSLLRPVEMNTLPNILKVRLWALLLCPPHVKDLPTFRYEYRQCYQANVTIESLKNVSNIIQISSMNGIDYISLTSPYVLAAQLYYVICNNNGSIEFNNLEQMYENYYSKPMKLADFNINSVNEFYNKFNLMFYVKGNKKNSVVVLNRNLQEHIAFKYYNNGKEEEKGAQWNSTTPAAGPVKKYSPPKPDTPPTPGSTLWWNSPSKLNEQSMNFSINIPINVDPSPFVGKSDYQSPAPHLLAIDDNPWSGAGAVAGAVVAPPEPHELPMPDKLLAKGIADDSGDSGVNIMLDNSPPDDVNRLSSEKHGAIKKKPFYGTFLKFK